MTDMFVSIRGADNLKDELARVRETLRDTDATIEKLTGRPANVAGRPFQRSSGQQRSSMDDSRGGGRGRGFVGYDSAGPPPAKRFAGAFGRLGLPVGGGSRTLQSRRGRDEAEEEEDLPHKPAIQSSVVATPKEAKTREEAIAEQQSGVGGRVGETRNRRMFGLLLGTLARFREDERTKEDQEVKRKAVEQRLEEKQRQERQRVISERKQLFDDRRRQQSKLRALEQKLELVEMHRAWEAESRNLECFIRTNARPHIFYLPKSHTPASSAKLEESKRILQNLVTERRKQLEEEIEEIMNKGEQGRDDDHEDGELGDSDHELNDSLLIKMEKSQKKASEPANGGDALSDIDDNDQAGIEYNLSADVGNIDALPVATDVGTDINEQQVNPEAMDQDSHQDAETAAEDAGSGKVAEDMPNKSGETDTIERNRETKERHSGDSEKRHGGREDKKDSSREDERSRHHSSGDKESRSKRRHESSRKRGGNDDDEKSDGGRGSRRRGSSRHRRNDHADEDRRRRHDRRKSDELKRRRDSSEDSASDKEGDKRGAKDRHDRDADNAEKVDE